MDCTHLLVICSLLALVAGPVSGSLCSPANRTADMDACVLEIQGRLYDTSAFWFGTDYKTRCPTGMAGGFKCSNRNPNSVDSLGKRLFPRRPTFELMDTYVDVKFTSAPGQYTGCGTTVMINETWVKTIDPLSDDQVLPWHVKNMPEITWSAAENTEYTLVVYDAGYFTPHAVYINIPGNDLASAEALDTYNGPLITFNIGNPYVFLLYRQSSDLTPTQVWLDRIQAANYTLDALVAEDALNLTGPVGINWMVATGDIYAAETMKSRGFTNACPVYVSKALHTKPRPFIPETAELSVSLDINFTTTDLAFTACCTPYSYMGRTFSTDPIGNPVYKTAETRSEGTLSFSLLKEGVMATARNFTGELHTLISVDPDVPITTVGTESRPLLHMLNVNINDGDISSGTVVRTYEGPTPPDTNPQYYYFLLYKHDSPINASTVTNYAAQNCGAPNRCLWNINQMVSDYNMTLVGANWIRAQYDDYVIFRNLQRNTTLAYEESICQGRQGYENPCPTAGSDVIMTSFMTTFFAIVVSVLFA